MFSITLNKAGIVCSNSKVFAGTDSIVELAKTSDIPEQYVHPQEKQCNYEPDLSNYATKDEVSGMSLIQSGYWGINDNNVVISGLTNNSHMILFLRSNQVAHDSNARLEAEDSDGSTLTTTEQSMLLFRNINGNDRLGAYDYDPNDAIRLPNIDAGTSYVHTIYHIYNLNDASFVHIATPIYVDTLGDWRWPLSHVIYFSKNVASLRYLRTSNKPNGTIYYWLYKA